MNLEKRDLDYMIVLIRQVRQAIHKRNTVEARRRLLDLENIIINITLDKPAKKTGAVETGENMVRDALNKTDGLL